MTSTTYPAGSYLITLDAREDLSMAGMPCDTEAADAFAARYTATAERVAQRLGIEIEVVRVTGAMDVRGQAVYQRGPAGVDEDALIDLWQKIHDETRA